VQAIHRFPYEGPMPDGADEQSVDKGRAAQSP
jgi:hypothetical protein